MVLIDHPCRIRQFDPYPHLAFCLTVPGRCLYRLYSRFSVEGEESNLPAALLACKTISSGPGFRPCADQLPYQGLHNAAASTHIFFKCAMIATSALRTRSPKTEPGRLIHDATVTDNETNSPRAKPSFPRNLPRPRLRLHTPIPPDQRNRVSQRAPSRLHACWYESARSAAGSRRTPSNSPNRHFSTASIGSLGVPQSLQRLRRAQAAQVRVCELVSVAT